MLLLSARITANPSQLFCGQVVTVLLRLMGLATAGMAPPRRPYTGLYSLFLLYDFTELFLLRDLGYDHDPNGILLWWLQVTGPVALQEVRPSILRVALFLIYPLLWLLAFTVFFCYGCL